MYLYYSVKPNNDNFKGQILWIKCYLNADFRAGSIEECKDN